MDIYKDCSNCSIKKEIKDCGRYILPKHQCAFDHLQDHEKFDSRYSHISPNCSKEDSLDRPIRTTLKKLRTSLEQYYFQMLR